MKGFICTRPGLIETIELPDPVPTAGQAILKIRRVNVCGTDLHAFEGTQPFFNYPRILGHEIAAELVVADGAEEFSPGDAVTIIPYFNCFTCLICRNGQPNCRAQIKVCGVHIDGAMISYFAVPSYSLVHHLGLEKIRSITNGDMVSVAIDATGSLKATNNGLQWLGHGRRYVLIGLQKADLIFSHPEFHKRETTLMSSRNATRADFDQVVVAIPQKRVDPSKYISRIVEASLMPQEFANWVHPNGGGVKVAINFSS
jgi:threonine dehydrogenase-like Zn-dependent dehydrogenase